MRIGLTTSDSPQEETPYCAARIDSAVVMVTGGATLTKNIGGSSNWDVVSEQVKELPASYEHNCVFTIRNSNIQD